MKWNITCIYCGHDFEAETWESGECPSCGAEYWWEEYCLPDYSDCYSYVEFEERQSP